MSQRASYRGGAGEPLVCIHGFTDTWRAWRPLLPGLERHHEVLCVSLAGHDGGAVMPEYLGVSALVDEVERDMDEAGLDRAHLLGNSLGGWIALELAARGRARSVVALSPAGGWERGGRAERRIGRLFRRNHRLLRLFGDHARTIAARPRLRSIALRDVVSRPWQVPPDAAFDMIVGAARCAVHLDGLDELRRGAFPDQLAAIDCPVRIVWGVEDRILPLRSASTRLRELVPRAEWVELEGLGHCPMWDDPQLVVSTTLAVTRNGAVRS
ncbi:MAG: alpha/beta hydrolase [Thermoleophilaceae bacterium]